MKVKLFDLEKKPIGDVELNSDIFGRAPRVDILKRVVDWQLAKKMSGCHKVKTVSEVAGSNKKPFKQKGTGNARQGNKRAVQLRGGGVSHGPVLRSHAHKLTKKVKRDAFAYALSAKLSEEKLFVVDDLKMSTVKTKEAKSKFNNFSQGRLFVIDSNEADVNLKLSTRNLPNITVVPQLGMNVYDIINSNCVLISKSSLEQIEQRLSV